MNKKDALRTYGTVLVCMMLLNFLLPRLLPGGPLDYIEGSDSGAMITETQKEAILAHYGLDQPVYVQFVQYLKDIILFDFGHSFSSKLPVREMILANLPNTLFIVGVAAIISTVLGLFFGLISGWKSGGRVDRSILMWMLGLSAIPEFLVGLILLLLFAVSVQWFPLSGAETPFLRDANMFTVFIDRLHHAFLPIMTLVLVNISSVYLIMRNSTIQIANEPFIEFAKIKGVKRATILFKHVAKAAILPIFTLIVIKIGTLLTGAVFVETVFSYPGIGKLLQEAILSRDYPLMHGLFFMFTVIILLLNALADLFYSRLDPRVKKVGENG